MRILCVSLYDNGGSLQQLSNAFNKYTEHTSVHLNFEPTWLEYDVDISGQTYTNEILLSKIHQAIGDVDFFIFSEMIPPRFNDLGFELKRTNTIIRCFGSITRSHLAAYRNEWSRKFYTFVSGGFDPTIHPYLGFVAYHIPNIYEFSDFPVPGKSLDKIRICHAATNKTLKSTEKVVEVFQALEKKHSDVETIIIHKVPWKESLKIKATCDITIDQFILGTYASSAIESMYLGHAVVSRLSPFVRSMHPDIPIIQAELYTLFDVLEDLIINPPKRLYYGARGGEYALREHDAEINIKKWKYLIQWVSEGFR